MQRFSILFGVVLLSFAGIACSDLDEDPQNEGLNVGENTNAGNDNAGTNDNDNAGTNDNDNSGTNDNDNSGTNDNDNSGTNNGDPGPFEICGAWDAGGDGGDCAMHIGYGYDGSSCVDLGSGCNCVGAHCDEAVHMMEDCEKMTRDCDAGCGDPDADICDEYHAFDPVLCPDDSAYTVVDCKPVCVDPDDCEVVDEPCPHPADGYEYISDDPWECNDIDIDCGADAQPFYDDDCGCGCVEAQIECPDPHAEDVLYYSDDPDDCDYFVDHTGCGADQELFDDDCGCGCIAEDGDYDCEIEGCPEGTYCHYDDGVCGVDTAEGRCEFAPTGCTDDMAENCGCDEEFYVGSSICAAPHSGVDTHNDPAYCLDDSCPGPGVEGVTYYGYTDQFCENFDPDSCGDDADPIPDSCGCGCVEQ